MRRLKVFSMPFPRLRPEGEFVENVETRSHRVAWHTIEALTPTRSPGFGMLGRTGLQVLGRF